MIGKVAAQTGEMTKVIIFSDLHITPDGEAHSDTTLARLRVATDEVSAFHADAAAVVVLGDIAHHGDIASYRLARRELSRLPMPFYLLAGNHDNRSKLREVFPELPSGFMQRTFPTPAGDFILADSVREGENIGEYCTRRGAWLRQTLEQASRPVFVCMHHPPFFMPYSQDIFDADYFRCFTEAIDGFLDKIRFFMFGHLHVTAGGTWRGVSFSVSRSFGRQTFFTDKTLGDEATDKTIYTAAAPHYGVLLIDEERVIFHHHSFMENRPCTEGKK